MKKDNDAAFKAKVAPEAVKGEKGIRPFAEFHRKALTNPFNSFPEVSA